MIIRNVLETDFPEVMRIGQRYSEETVIGTMTKEQLLTIARVCKDNGIAILAEDDIGVIGVIAGHFIEGMAMGKFCEEVIWYVEPEHRGIGLMLFERFMDACEESGCDGVAMSAYNNRYLKVVDRLYKNNGFKEVDRKYYKSFK